MTDVKQEVPLSVYERTRLITSFIGMLVLMGLVVALNDNRLVISAVLLVGLAKTFEYQSELFYGLFQRLYHFRVIAFSLALKSVLVVFAILTTVIVTGDLLAGLLAVLFVTAAVCIFYDRNRRKSLIGTGGERLNSASLKLILYTGLPLGVSALLISLNVNIPRLILGGYVGMSELGYFASAAAFVQVGSLVIISLGQALAPRMTVAFQAGRYAEYRKFALAGVGFAVLTGMIGMGVAYAWGEFFLALVVKSTHPEVQNFMFWVFLAAPFQYAMSMYGFVVSSTRRNRALVYVNLAVSVGTALVGWYLIPSQGSLGAVWALVVGSMLGCALYTIVLVKNIRDQIGS
ncbi:polysaccharide biosynthesis protein [Comamonas sp. BIGb0124]|nr:polysaccharide biosynthesis protein [Comamonas sp. BIGb0124]